MKEMIRFQDARGYYLCMYDVKKNKQEVKLVNDNQNITRK